jgi:hypothetical protein
LFYSFRTKRKATTTRNISTILDFFGSCIIVFGCIIFKLKMDGEKIWKSDSPSISLSCQVEQKTLTTGKCKVNSPSIPAPKKGRVGLTEGMQKNILVKLFYMNKNM